MNRITSLERKTAETDIKLSLNIDGTGKSEISTGVGFFDHMLTALSKHSKMDISLTCKGDLHIDDHHTVEDCSIVLGQAFDTALGDKRGITRFASAYAPLDEAVARAVIDLSGRPYCVTALQLENSLIGDVQSQNLEHAIESFALNAKITVHVEVLYGSNDHHKAEAAFKALAIAIKNAVSITGSDIPSTKGVI
ncbi:MAG: imidazoleglycerol-phosphate dehydratase HisB [Deltaproteobacteria bacterium]|nr:imidazoleglycerol-phosphate dehydratase HisB [Deltaproteobacteria bacterium]